jgi:hypothetical protein
VPSDAAPAARPPGLLVATAVVAAEGLALLGFGLWLGVELVVSEPSNRDVGSGSAVYFVVLGALVLLLAWSLWRRSGWSHGGSVFAQVLALPIAWTMLRAGSWELAVPTAALAVAALVALLQPATRTALGRG